MTTEPLNERDLLNALAVLDGAACYIWAKPERRVTVWADGNITIQRFAWD